MNANEFYDTPQKSKISNGFIEVDETLRLEDVVDIYFPKSKEKAIPSKSQIKPEGKPGIDNNNQDNC